MRLSDHRKLIGAVLGEAITCMLLSIGLVMVILLVLNGFSLMATAEFIENFTRRMTAATGPLAAQFERSLVITVLFLSAMTGAIRAIDRRAFEKKERQA